MQVDRDKNRKGEFFDNYEEVQEACRHLFELRMSLIPYLYASFAQYHQRGIPPFRALVMDYPDDANTYEIDDSYMMGDSILVAPLIAGQTERKVYLPRGTWKDFWTNETYAGETWYDIAADLDHIPVFVKDNTLLPIATPLQCVADDAVFEIVVRIYGDSPKDFVLYFIRRRWAHIVLS
jgi:alpha-D-xyloside xylohydrolase